MAVGTAVAVNVAGMAGVMRIEYSVAADTELVAAVTDKKIRVVAAVMASGASSTTSLESGTSTAILGPFNLSAAPMVLPPFPTGWCETAAGAALTIDLSATDTNTGSIWYVVV